MGCCLFAGICATIEAIKPAIEKIIKYVSENIFLSLLILISFYLLICQVYKLIIKRRKMKRMKRMKRAKKEAKKEEVQD